ncbi:transforming growth factor beta activator LRRC32-like [Coturnix japonica]|uniref:Leucine-rich repeat-containing protein 32-like n=1 Tax=Coturnix japonica TaxID=93934 RepID=A0A8C2SRQ1_COTJA|nr:transforming growth factor beta activator LRRC32-like [Coturnix japonica]
MRSVPGAGCLLLCLLPAILRAQAGGEAKLRPPPCQQSLTKVSCRAAELHSFPESLPQGVKHLDLSHNLLQNLSESHLPALGQLEHLDLCSNLLETISGPVLARLPRLHTLLLGSNRLHQNYRDNAMAFSALRGTEMLDLSANGLENHMVGGFLSGLTALRALHLSGNRLSQLPAGIFQGSPQLSELDLSNNYIMDIEEGVFEALRELAVLSLALNSLHCLSSFSLRQLQVLNLSHNALEIFGWEEGQGPYLLQVLDLSHNRLLFFPQLPAAHHLVHLNLSHNAITSLDPSSHHPAQFVLRYEEMASFNTSLGTAASLTRLAKLDLSYNCLQLLPLLFFRAMHSLLTLSVAMNCLQDITMELVTRDGDGDRNGTAVWQEDTALSVHSMDLHGNAIRALPHWFFDVLPQLEAIDLGSNSLQPCGSDMGSTSGGGSPGAEPCTAFHSIPHLQHLSLRRNSLTQLLPRTFSQTPLLSLDLSENRGLAVPWAVLEGLEHSLQQLWLQGNHMDNSRAEIPCLDELRVLDLSDNNLSLLPMGLFCSPLQTLDVSGNKLPALPKQALMRWTHSLQALCLAGNPFHCCELGWLDELQAAGVQLPDLHRACCIHHSITNRTAPLSSRPPWPCPQPWDGKLVLVLAALLGVLLCAGCGLCWLRGNRVGVLHPQPQTEREAEGGPAHSDTKV